MSYSNNVGVWSIRCQQKNQPMSIFNNHVFTPKKVNLCCITFQTEHTLTKT